MIFYIDSNCLIRFLLAQLHIRSLAAMRRRRDVRHALLHLPKELYESYDEVMIRIWEQNEYDRNLAKQVLGWISHVKRQLTVTELQHAIAFTIDPVEINDADLFPEADLVSVCAGIVTVDPNSNIIRLVHYTTEEYFEHIGKNKFPAVQITISKTCLNYLGLSGFHGPCHDSTWFKQRLEKYNFGQYAALFWGLHTRGEAEYEPDVQHAVLSLLACKNKRDSMLQLKTYANSSWGDIGFTKGQTLLHVLAMNGLATICRFIFDEHNAAELQALGLSENDTNVHAEDGLGRTPLSCAAVSGNLDVVKWLVQDAGANVESQDNRWGRTPLSWAAWNGHLEVVKWLVQEAGADVDSQSASHGGRTPLSWAAENGHLEAVKFLVQEARANVERKQERGGWTPLSWAAKYGHLEVVKFLVWNAGAKVDSRDDGLRMPLSRAAEHGHLEAVKWLVLEAGAEVGSKDKGGQTPLSYAAKHGHLEAVKSNAVPNSTAPSRVEICVPGSHPATITFSFSLFHPSF